VTPLPIEVGERALPRGQPTPSAILGWIANAAGQSWFPSQHAATTGTDRDALDEPLAELRIAGLVRIATWVRGVGQGYMLTSEGERALTTGEGIPTEGELPERRESGSGTGIPDDAIFLSPEQGSSSHLAIDPRSSVVVPALLIANVLWFFVGLVATIRGGYSLWTYLLRGNTYVCHRLGSVGGEDLLRGEWWRLLTSCFVHGGCIHLVVNLFALAMIGPLAELLWGRRRFAIIYGLSGLAGSSLAMALQPQNPVVGASGAIWGVLMSLVVWFVAFRVQLPSDVTTDAIRRLALAIVLNGGVNLLPGVSWQSHLGGAVVGLVSAGLLHILRFATPNRQRIALGLLYAIPILSVGGLVVVMGRGENWIAFRDYLAREQMQRAVNAASKSFDEDVVPLLNQLNPNAILSAQQAIAMQFHVRHGSIVYLPPVSPVHQAAVMQLLLTPARRNAATVAETRAKLTEMKTLADKAVDLLSSPPVGVESLDRHRERAKEFAEAQSRSCSLLLDMLVANTIPNESAWIAWGNAKRSAGVLWEQIRKK
jgi:rhomboid protease GluP